jgi:GntP family gluconate:H+ symporter
MITSASILAPLIASGSLDPGLTAAAIGAGSLGIVHVNASFFWLFKELHGLSVSSLLRSYSILTGILALSGGLMVLVIYYIRHFLF